MSHLPFKFDDEIYNKVINDFKKIKEKFVVYLIREDSVELVTSDNDYVIEFILGGVSPHYIKEYKKGELYQLLLGLSGVKSKYRKFGNFVVIKYNYYNEVYNSAIEKGRDVSINSNFQYMIKLKQKREIVALERKDKIKRLLSL